MRATTITAVRLAVQADGTIKVYAQAEVSTSGWTGAALTPREHNRPPDDGIADFDFEARPPTGSELVADLASPLQAEIVLERQREHYWGSGRPLRGVRVHGGASPMLARCDDPKCQVRLVHPGSESWRWPLASAPPADLGAELVGMRLRVRNSDDPPVTDFLVDGVMIEIAPDNARIVTVRRG